MNDRRHRSLAGWLVALLGLGSLAAACSGADPGGPEPARTQSATVRVFGAASLTDAFQELETAFEARNPRFDVELNLGGSAGLRAQILDGAPVDVFAPANELVMDQVVDELMGDAAIIEPPQPFAVNRLTIAVPTGNPAGVVGVDDFSNPELFLGLCAEAVPCGHLARLVLDNAGVEPSVDTRESDVRALLTKVEAGELDAGIVYATDVLASDRVEAVALPDGVNAAANYPIAVLSRGASIDGGRAFVSFVLDDEGRRILAGHGFDAP